MTTNKSCRPVAILGGVRTPFCRSNTYYQDLTNLDMMGTALDGLIGSYRLRGKEIGEVVGGAVVTHAKDWNLAREAVVGSKLAPSTPATTMMQACGTSLQALMGSAAKIANGQIESAIGIGSDTVSDAPVVFSRRFAQRLVKLSKARSFKEKLALFKGFSPRELAPMPPSTSEPRTGLSMGNHCELMAQLWSIPRADQDELAFESHTKAIKAYEEGYHDDLIIPCAGVFRDNNIRDDVTLEKLSTLRTSFEKSSRGTLTAANSTPLTDGASSVLISSEQWAKDNGHEVKALLVDAETAAVDYVQGEGLLMAPTVAVARLLKRQNMTLQDFDFYEIHEAFAAQVLATLKAWEDEDYCREKLGLDSPLGSIDRSKLNVKGSSLAYGHPFAATGARIVALLAKLISEKPGSTGLISICTAGGMGVAAILKSPENAENPVIPEVNQVEPEAAPEAEIEETNGTAEQ